MRHDLLTPINHLIGYTEMMLEDCEGQESSAFLPDLEQIRVTSKELQAAIERLLPSSPEAADPGRLGEIHDRLRDPLERLFHLIGRVEDGAPGGRQANLLPDLGKLRVAAERLNQHVEELTGRGLVAPPPSRAVSPSTPTASPAPALAEDPARPSTPARSRLLVVDDDATNRDVLCRRLEREGYEVSTAQDGRDALARLAEQPCDLVLLDFMMPGLTGAEVLATIKSTPSLRHLPVIMISATDEVTKVVRCIELGAEDYLSKPFDPVLLRARIGACLEKKHLRDEEQRKSAQLVIALQEAENQRSISAALLRNILPDEIARELVAKGEVDPRYFEDVTIVFTDFVGFTKSTESIAAEDLVLSLHTYFTAFDRIVERYGLEKLKTIGDSYMLAGGLPARSSSNPVDAVLASLEILAKVEELGGQENGPAWQVRIGVHTGPVIAGVVGIKKFAFDVWGETVNLASRMESSGLPNRINISGQTYARVKDFFACEPRGKILTKEQEEYDMYLVNGVSPRLMDGPVQAAAPTLPRSVPLNFVRRYRIYFQKEPLAFPGFRPELAE